MIAILGLILMAISVFSFFVCLPLIIDSRFRYLDKGEKEKVKLWGTTAAVFFVLGSLCVMTFLLMYL